MWYETNTVGMRGLLSMAYYLVPHTNFKYLPLKLKLAFTIYKYTLSNKLIVVARCVTVPCRASSNAFSQLEYKLAICATLPRRAAMNWCSASIWCIGGLRRFDAPRELSFLLRIEWLMGWHSQSIWCTTAMNWYTTGPRRRGPVVHRAALQVQLYSLPEDLRSQAIMFLNIEIRRNDTRLSAAPPIHRGSWNQVFDQTLPCVVKRCQELLSSNEIAVLCKPSSAYEYM